MRKVADFVKPAKNYFDPEGCTGFHSFHLTAAAGYTCHLSAFV
jgi:hypothetical protein